MLKLIEDNGDVFCQEKRETTSGIILEFIIDKIFLCNKSLKEATAYHRAHKFGRQTRRAVYVICCGLIYFFLIID